MKKGNLSNLLLFVILIVGLSLLLYPSFADYWNSLGQTQTVNDYVSQVSNLDNTRYKQLLTSAQQYNEELIAKSNLYNMSEQESKEYYSLLNLSGSGIMGYIEIPNIDVLLPIYHGVSDTVLQNGAGHLEWTSLPVGGKNTHCAISSHRGLPSAKLFTDLDQMVVGDTFLIHVLDETLTYEVDQILIVEPHEIKDLSVEAGKDLVTLVTCTPYGINTHRLLVRGHRIANEVGAHNVRITADAMLLEPMVVAPVLAAPMLLILLIALLVTTRKRK